MRKVKVKEVTNTIKDMCIEINHFLSKDMKLAIDNAQKNETSERGKKVLGQLRENLEIAGTEMIPICQDTGMAVVFLKIGQDVVLVEGNIEDAVNEGVRLGYKEGYLRKSVVSDPIIRQNTNDNTPAVIHYEIVPGNNIEITLAPKGFGSENMSKVYMLKPADGAEGVKNAVIDAVKEAGPNACPPIVVGVGIGGTFEKATILSKKALTREVGSYSKLEHIKEMEEELLESINELGIGPGGLGGKVTALRCKHRNISNPHSRITCSG